MITRSNELDHVKKERTRKKKVKDVGRNENGCEKITYSN